MVAGAYLNDEVEDVPEASDAHLVASEFRNEDMHFLEHGFIICSVVAGHRHDLGVRG